MRNERAHAAMWHSKPLPPLTLLLQLATGRHQTIGPGPGALNPYGPCALNPRSMYGTFGPFLEANPEEFSLTGQHAVLHDYSKDRDASHSTFCHLNQRPICNSSCTIRGQNATVLDGDAAVRCGTAENACVIPAWESCDLDCVPGYMHTGTSRAQLKCRHYSEGPLSSSGLGLEVDVSCTACEKGKYKATVGNVGCVQCEAGQDTRGREGAQFCRAAGQSWCSGKLPVAHTRADACSTSLGTVTKSTIDPGDNCTIIGHPQSGEAHWALNPFEPGWQSTIGARTYTFQCGMNGEWSQLSPDPNRFPLIPCYIMRNDANESVVSYPHLKQWCQPDSQPEHSPTVCPDFMSDNVDTTQIIATALGLAAAALVALGLTVSSSRSGIGRQATPQLSQADTRFRCSVYLVLLHPALLATSLFVVFFLVGWDTIRRYVENRYTFWAVLLKAIVALLIGGPGLVCIRNDMRIAKARSAIAIGRKEKTDRSLVSSTVLGVMTGIFLIFDPACQSDASMCLPFAILYGGSVLAYWTARVDLLERSSGLSNSPTSCKFSVLGLLELLRNMFQDLPLKITSDSTLRQPLVSASEDSQVSTAGVLSIRDNKNVHSNSYWSSGANQIPFSEISELSSIASGAYGVVYRGHWSSGGMTVALKTAKKSTVNGLYMSVRQTAGDDTSLFRAYEPKGGTDGGFRQEIMFSQGASHRNIIQCFGVTNGIFPPATRPQDALVMEFVPMTLYQCIHRVEEGHRARGLMADARRSVAAGIIAGMIYLHEHKKVAHLDLKSHNILMDQDRPKIADFGLTSATAQSLRATAAEMLANTSESAGARDAVNSGVRASFAPSVNSMSQKMQGTSAWMAPEMGKQEVQVTTKADVYSFGVILWELVSPNVDLFEAWETAALGSQPRLMNEAIIPTWAASGIRPLIPPVVTVQEQDWEEAIKRCWQTDPDSRPSFRRLARWQVFRADNDGDQLQHKNDDGGDATVSAAAAAVGVDPARPQATPTLYASETDVSIWLKAAGLGHHIIVAATRDEDYCDLEAFESIALGCGAGAAAAKLEFMDRMRLNAREKDLFAAALEQLKLRLVAAGYRENESSDMSLATSSSTSGKDFGAAAGDGCVVGLSRPASPLSAHEFGVLE